MQSHSFFPAKKLKNLQKKQASLVVHEGSPSPRESWCPTNYVDINCAEGYVTDGEKVITQFTCETYGPGSGPTESQDGHQVRFLRKCLPIFRVSEPLLSALEKQSNSSWGMCTANNYRANGISWYGVDTKLPNATCPVFQAQFKIMGDDCLHAWRTVAYGVGVGSAVTGLTGLFLGGYGVYILCKRYNVGISRSLQEPILSTQGQSVEEKSVGALEVFTPSERKNIRLVERLWNYAAPLIKVVVVPGGIGGAIGSFSGVVAQWNYCMRSSYPSTACTDSQPVRDGAFYAGMIVSGLSLFTEAYKYLKRRSEMPKPASRRLSNT